MEYYLRRVSRNEFRVAKFDGTVAPSRVYYVTYYLGFKRAKCNCWGWRHNPGDCLHIRMVEEWYKLHCPIGGFYWWPETDDHDEEMEFFSLPYSKGFYFNAKGELTR